MIVKLLLSILLIFNHNALGDTLPQVLLMMTTLKRKNNHPKVHIYLFMRNKEQILFN